MTLPVLLLVYSMGVRMWSIQQQGNGSIHTTGMKLKNASDGEEFIDTKVGDVHWTDKDLRPSHICR